MKMYAIVNQQYLSEKQCGIQATHACSELFSQYHLQPRSKAFKSYAEWAIYYKKLILVEGGNCVTLNKTFKKLKKMADEIGLPIVKFKEDNTLNNAVTAIGLIFPTEESLDFLDMTTKQYETYQKMEAILSTLRLV
jgi:uncharacterized lipoprotein NlpE involved in copper resistance